MKITNAIMVIFVCAIIFCLSGCGKTGCTMTVLSSYSGTGIDGQDLGSGSFSETFSVSAGDVFYEDYNGHWKRENINGNENILKIIDINNAVLQSKLMMRKSQCNTVAQNTLIQNIRCMTEKIISIVFHFRVIKSGYFLEITKIPERFRGIFVIYFRRFLKSYAPRPSLT